MITKRSFGAHTPVFISSYQFIYSYSDRTLVNIEDDTGSAMVMLKGHTLVNRGVDFNVNIISSLLTENNVINESFIAEGEKASSDSLYLESSQICCCRATTIGLKCLLKQRPRLGSVSKTVWHFYKTKFNIKKTLQVTGLHQVFTYLKE